jgi:small-conductance mechanosensitive channel
MMPLQLSLSSDAVKNIEFVAAGVLVLLIFLIAARLASQFVASELHKRHIPTGMIVTGRRVVTVLLLVVGVWAALGFAIQSANVTLLGILLATVIASLGLQDLLKDYVSGYYVLLERHFRVGDRIALDEWTGEVVDIKLRVTLLRTEQGNLVVVPNSELFGRPVTVYAKGSPDAHAAVEAQPKSEPPP